MFSSRKDPTLKTDTSTNAVDIGIWEVLEGAQFLSPVKPLYSNWREENWAFAKADFDPLVHHLDHHPDVDHDGAGDVSDT